ncbi:Intraflagellar transport protein 46 homolog [Sergentomyia squamirostris]
MEMYDEEIEVKNGREIDTPPNLDVNNAIQFIQSDLQKLSDGEESLMDFPLSRPDDKKPASLKSFNRRESDTSGGSDSASEEINKRFADGDFNPKDFEHLEAPTDIKEMFQYIVKYTPQKIDIEYRLQPFIPDYIPAVGDIDAFLKVISPVRSLSGKENLNPFIDTLGLTILDEPCGQQSEPALLHMKLRSVSTVPHAQDHPPAILKSPKDLSRWIAEIQALHSNQPQQTLLYYEKYPVNIDTLMAEWPPILEKTFNELGFPSVDLDCSLIEYINIVAGLLDIPLKGKTQADYIYVLHTLFSLFAAVKRP